MNSIIEMAANQGLIFNADLSVGDLLTNIKYELDNIATHENSLGLNIAQLCATDFDLAHTLNQFVPALAELNETKAKLFDARVRKRLENARRNNWIIAIETLPENRGLILAKERGKGFSYVMIEKPVSNKKEKGSTSLAYYPSDTQPVNNAVENETLEKALSLANSKSRAIESDNANLRKELQELHNKMAVINGNASLNATKASELLAANSTLEKRLQAALDKIEALTSLANNLQGAALSASTFILNSKVNKRNEVAYSHLSHKPAKEKPVRK